MPPDSAGESRAFPRAQRLTRGSELADVRLQGKRVRTAVMDVRATASLRAYPRVGVVIPKYKHNSVDRNRLKRRVRELVRLEWLPSLPAMDVVVRVTPVAYDRTFDALRDEMRRVWQRLLRVSLPTVRPTETTADTPGVLPE